jgi:antitoxin MazE
MKAVLRKMGNSQGVIIPKALISQFGFDKEVEMRVTPTGLVIEKPKALSREGWEEACAALASERPDEDWLGFGDETEKDTDW